jgi:hypothetical protein
LPLPAIVTEGDIELIKGLGGVKVLPSTFAPGENSVPPLPVAVEWLTNPPVISGLRVID